MSVKRVARTFVRSNALLAVMSHSTDDTYSRLIIRNGAPISATRTTAQAPSGPQTQKASADPNINSTANAKYIARHFRSLARRNGTPHFRQVILGGVEN